MRDLCLKCFWPKQYCFCPHIRQQVTKCHFVLLMHPKEYKKEKAGTGRLTHLALPNSEIIMGIAFDESRQVQELLNNPENACFLLYPGSEACDVSAGEVPFMANEKRPVIFLLDATWACAKKMLKLSPCLQSLPRLQFTPDRPSAFIIKQQPDPLCLSTIEATYCLLLELHKVGIEDSKVREDFLHPFLAMQKFQMECASDPARQGYRKKKGYSLPAERSPKKRAKSGRSLFFIDQT